MIESLSESESVSAGGGGSTGCGSTGGGGLTVSSVLASSLVSPLFPLSIKVLRGNGVSVTRVGWLLRVLADTGVFRLVDIQI